MDLVAGAVDSIISKLGELLKAEYKLQKGLPAQIESLKNELESAHTALCKVGETPPEQLDPQVRLWAREVREASYDMEDILDTFLVEVVEGGAPAEAESKDGLRIRLQKKMAKLFKKSKARRNIAAAIDNMKRRLQEVSDRRDRYLVPVAKPATDTTVDRRLMGMHKDAAQIIGIEKTRAELISKLQSSSHRRGGAQALGNSNKMMIVCVVGVGGLGKTTLAKAVYDELSPGYDCRAFVSIGRKPDLVQVFTNIFFHVDKKEYKIIRDIKDPQLLIDELRKFLENKRYFIVIDDVWDIESWRAIRSALDEKSSRSRVIKTTRNRELACGDEIYYPLNPLTHDNSKKLFYMRLFGCEDKCPANHPAEAAEKILGKCGGVPLAIITMASLLLGKLREDWFEVCNSPGFYRRGRDNKQVDDTLWILSLSYYDLPCHLKSCLLYLSAFLEDSIIDKDSLIWMWIAEGFVEKKPGYRSFEVGEKYFHDLINRSMIQVVDSEIYGIMDGCRIHDMVHDLIVSLSDEENFVSDDGPLSQSQARRLALQNRELYLTSDIHVNLPQLRSFIVLQCGIAKWYSHPRLNLIRVLALQHCEFREGCDSLELIGNLLHLRYLGIRDTWIPELPEGIGALKFLQTLDLEETGIKELPHSIGMLTKLVCLRAKQISAPDGVIGRLTSLVELQIAGPHDNDNSNRQFVKDLGNLCEIRVLKIDTIRVMDEGMQTDFKHSLGNLQKMQHLRLCKLIDTVDTNAWYTALPCRDLRCLFLGSNIRFRMLPLLINSAHLPSLSHLEIHVDDVDEQGLKALGGLPVLCYLKLITRGSITCNIEADGCFQKLRSLVLPYSMVQSTANVNSSALFCICFILGGMAIDRRRKKDHCTVVPTVVMPNLEELQFAVSVKKLKENNASCADLGLENFTSIRKVKVQFYCRGAYARDAGRAHASLRHAIEVHPNRPLLQIE